jgi:hypothetical protein
VLSELLAQRDYKGFCGYARSSRHWPGDMSRVVQRYRRTIVPLPTGAYLELNLEAISKSNPQQWSLRGPVWTKEDSRSNLSLEITLQNTTGNIYTGGINDLYIG